MHRNIRGPRTRTITHSPVTVAVALALSLAASGCGGGDDSEAATSEGSSTQNCRTVYTYETVAEPGYCANYVCFNYRTVTKEKRVCD